MDWWESKHVEVDIPAATSDGPTQTAAFDVTCTPCQHFTGRGIFDRFKSLWASWVVEEAASGQPGVQSDSTGVKLYFAGDTGYRSVPDGKNEDEMPTCPVFSEIGERFGGFDFAMIPIGCVVFVSTHDAEDLIMNVSFSAYLPRSFMSPIHCAPQDSVRIFKDIRAKRALGMHWGYARSLLFLVIDTNLTSGPSSTWMLTTEEVTEPPKRLAEECKKAGIEEGAFEVCEIGQTMFF
jgi:N-acyl-phosphatidylethanolamine-hydrolysing phospholipase D